jgi:hypothetical protein
MVCDVIHGAIVTRSHVTCLHQVEQHYKITL